MQFFQYLLIILFLTSMPVYGQEPQQGYSTETLKDPIYSHSEIMVEMLNFHNYLVDNHHNLTEQQIPPLREHLYYLINSYVKFRFAENKIILPQEKDAIADMLFYWPDQLGVYGGQLLANKFSGLLSAPLPQKTITPESYNLELKGDLFTLNDTQGAWSVHFPYYYMPFLLQENLASDNTKTQLAIISTGSSKDNSQVGHSQATIMLVYTSSDVPLENFTQYWQTRVQIPETAEQRELQIKKLDSVYDYKPDISMHVEATFFKNKNGLFAVIYTGNDGAYQQNRQHFLDFLNALEIN